MATLTVLSLAWRLFDVWSNLEFIGQKAGVLWQILHFLFATQTGANIIVLSFVVLFVGSLLFQVERVRALPPANDPQPLPEVREVSAIPAATQPVLPPAPEPVAEPEIDLVHFAFDAVCKDVIGWYVRAGKGSDGPPLEAAIAEFRFRPDGDASRFVDVQADILYKYGEGNQTRVSSAIWLGKELPKVRLLQGETASLFLTGAYELDGKFTTYESTSHEIERIERILWADTVRVCVRLTTEYMNTLRDGKAWYFKLTTPPDVFQNCTIEKITRKEFEAGA